MVVITNLMAAPVITDSFSKGKKIAENHGLILVLFFTGSDWSKSSKAFLEEIQKQNSLKDFIFVHIDFPELNIQSKEVIEENYVLKNRYIVHSFPTVVVLDSNQNEITRFGYPIPNNLSLISHLKKICFQHQILKNKFENACKNGEISLLPKYFEEARNLGLNRLAKTILDIGTSELLSTELCLEKYALLMCAREFSEAKCVRKVLLKSGDERALSRLALIDFQQEKSIKPVKTFLKNCQKKHGEYFWQMHLFVSEFLLDENKKEEALLHARVSYKYAPDKDKQKISQFISKMLP